MNQLLNLKKPTLEQQIKFVRQLQTETVRVIKTSEMLEMLRAIEENLIAVELWNKSGNDLDDDEAKGEVSNG